MRQILSQWRTIGATLFAVVIVTAAYILARGIEHPTMAQASTETALLQAIATKDSTGDGLPDWQKALYGIPLNATTTDYFHLGMTDGEAVAKGLIVPNATASIAVASSTATTTAADNTVTAAFSQNFFQLYLAAKQANGGVDLTQAQSDALAQQALAQLTQNYTPRPDFKTAADLTVSGTGPDALRAYAAAAEAVIHKQKSDATMSEIGYLSAALNGDISAPAHLVSLANIYHDSAAGLAVLPVPKELVADHLAIVNGLMRMSEIDNDFSRVNQDPLTAILALQMFQDALNSTTAAFTDLATVYASEGVVLPAGTPGSAYVNLMSHIQPLEESAAPVSL